MNYEARMAQQDFEGKKSFDTIKKSIWSLNLAFCLYQKRATRHQKPPSRCIIL